MRFREVRSPRDVARLVDEVGFLPLLPNWIPGFSAEECCPPEILYDRDAEGPWEWKGPTARGRTCMYGKLFDGRAGYVSLEWLPDLANYRRDGYDFDARFDDGLASLRDRTVYNALAGAGELLSVDLRKRCGALRGFDASLTRLQMQCYVAASDFVYQRDKFGREYGWGVAKYAAPETLFGPELVTSAYSRDPKESRLRILDHLRKILPDAPEADLVRLVGR